MDISDALWQVALETDDEDAVRRGLMEGKSASGFLSNRSVYPLEWAIHNGALKACRLLLEAGAPLDEKQGGRGHLPQRTALLTALNSSCVTGKNLTKTARWLVDQGAQWDPEDALGNNPFVIALRRQEWPCAQFLWRSNAARLARSSPLGVSVPALPSRRQAQCMAAALSGNALPEKWLRVFAREGVFQDLSTGQLWALATSHTESLHFPQARLWFGLSKGATVGYVPGDMPAIGKNDPREQAASHLWSAVTGAALKIDMHQSERRGRLELGRFIADLKKRGVPQATPEHPMVARIHAEWTAQRLAQQTPVVPESSAPRLRM